MISYGLESFGWKLVKFASYKRPTWVIEYPRFQAGEHKLSKRAMGLDWTLGLDGIGDDYGY